VRQKAGRPAQPRAHAIWLLPGVTRGFQSLAEAMTGCLASRPSRRVLASGRPPWRARHPHRIPLL